MKPKMIAFVLSPLIAISLLWPRQQAKADMFGGDLVILAQILLKSIDQLLTMREILSTGHENIQMIQDIHRGIDDALSRADTVRRNPGSGVFTNLNYLDGALRHLEGFYGVPTQSDEEAIQNSTDTGAAEAISLNNTMQGTSDDLDRLGKQIGRQSRFASPKGAQKLTAQSLGLVVQAMSESLRVQSKSLKLQAQSLAVQNRKDKEYGKQVRNVAKNYKSNVSELNPTFSLPRL